MFQYESFIPAFTNGEVVVILVSIPFAISAIFGYWVYKDAKSERIPHPIVWGFYVFLTWGIGWPIYDAEKEELKSEGLSALPRLLIKVPLPPGTEVRTLRKPWILLGAMILVPLVFIGGYLADAVLVGTVVSVLLILSAVIYYETDVIQ
jgi:hypothetical protein